MEQIKKISLFAVSFLASMRLSALATKEFNVRNDTAYTIVVVDVSFQYFP